MIKGLEHEVAQDEGGEGEREGRAGGVQQASVEVREQETVCARIALLLAEVRGREGEGGGGRGREEGGGGRGREEGGGEGGGWVGEGGRERVRVRGRD
jgi:hypothetical protein